MKVPPVLSPAKLCECLQCKQTWMNDFLRLDDQVGQEMVHQQENLPQGQQGSFLAAAVGSWEMTDTMQELTEKQTSNTTLDLKRNLKATSRQQLITTEWHQPPQVTNYFCGGKKKVLRFFLNYLRNARSESHIWDNSLTVTTVTSPHMPSSQYKSCEQISSLTEGRVPLTQAAASLQISPFSPKPSILGAMTRVSFTASAAGKSVQPTPPARKIIMVTRTALSWHTTATSFSSAENNSVIASATLECSSISVCKLTTHTKVFLVFQDEIYCLKINQN